MILNKQAKIFQSLSSVFDYRVAYFAHFAPVFGANKESLESVPILIVK